MRKYEETQNGHATVSLLHVEYSRSNSDFMSRSVIWFEGRKREWGGGEGWGLGAYWYLMEGFLSTETLEADVWIKNLWFSCQECEQFQSNCQPHQEREEGAQMCVCVCVCVRAHVWLEKFTECKTEIYKAKPAESIISYITTLRYQMTTCGPSAVRPMCRLRAECAFIYFGCLSEHLVATGTVPNSLRRSKCSNSQWKEVGREESAEKRQETVRQKERWVERRGARKRNVAALKK